MCFGAVHRLLRALRPRTTSRFTVLVHANAVLCILDIGRHSGPEGLEIQEYLRFTKEWVLWTPPLGDATRYTNAKRSGMHVVRFPDPVTKDPPAELRPTQQTTDCFLSMVKGYTSLIVSALPSGIPNSRIRVKSGR